MLVLLLGPDNNACEQLGDDLAAIMGWPFHAALDAHGMDALVGEIARDAAHGTDVHGSRVVVGWHFDSIMREVAVRPRIAIATLTHVRRAIDWSAVMVFPVGNADVRALALARALGAYVGKPVDPNDLFVSAPGLAWEITQASKLLGLDDVTFGCGSA